MASWQKQFSIPWYQQPRPMVWSPIIFTEIPSCLEAGHPIDDLLPWNIKREIQTKTTPSRGVSLGIRSHADRASRPARLSPALSDNRPLPSEIPFYCKGNWRCDRSVLRKCPLKPYHLKQKKQTKEIKSTFPFGDKSAKKMRDTQEKNAAESQDEAQWK